MDKGGAKAERGYPGTTWGGLSRDVIKCAMFFCDQFRGFISAAAQISPSCRTSHSIRLLRQYVEPLPTYCPTSIKKD